jgi:hypothetical protein
MKKKRWRRKRKKRMEDELGMHYFPIHILNIVALKKKGSYDALHLNNILNGILYSHIQ